MGKYNSSYCQDENIYNIQVSFKDVSETRQLTGFYLDSAKTGIITALHGVIGSSNITAWSGDKIYEKLSIVEIDIEHDLAVISSPVLQEDLKKIKGLTRGNTNPETIAGKEMFLYGTSYDVRATEDIKVRIMQRPIWLLDDVIEPIFKEQIKVRKSPSLFINVIRVQGPIAPGNSGAPVLFDNKVIGIACGGLREGQTDRCWIIPINSMKFDHYLYVKKTDDYIKLLEANNLNPYLFNYQLVVGQMTAAELEFCGFLDTLLAVAQSNFEGAIGDFIKENGPYELFESNIGMPNTVWNKVNVLADHGPKRGAFSIIYSAERGKKGKGYTYEKSYNLYNLICETTDKCLLSKGFNKKKISRHQVKHKFLEYGYGSNFDQIIRYTNSERGLVVYLRFYTIKFKENKIHSRNFFFGTRLFKKQKKQAVRVDMLIYNFLR